MRTERYPEFLAARRELLADAANTFLNQLRSGASPQPVEALERLTVIDIPDDRDTRATQVADLIADLTELGCAEPAVDCEISDPATGTALAIAEACRPEGLQPGQGDPVVLELDPEESDIPRLEELSYEVFTTVDSLRGYVRRRNLEAAGEAEETLATVEDTPVTSTGMGGNG